MDIVNLGLTGLVALGAVNVIGFFKPDLDSRIKFALSFVVAFAVTFIPVNIANLLLENIKIALTAAFGISGIYKLAQKAGGTSNAPNK
jgi:hypothetical protein